MFLFWLDADSCARSAHHQHTAVAEDFVIDVDADNGVRAHRLRAFCHLLERLFACVYQLFFVGAGTAAEKVGQSRGEILDEVDARNNLSGNLPQWGWSLKSFCFSFL